MITALWVAFCAGVVIGLAAWMVQFYAHPKTHLLVRGVVAVCWILTFSLCFLLPVDLLGESREEMTTVWKTVYWISFLMTWLVVPLLQGYYDAGEFTQLGKLKSSLRSNLRFYGVMVILVACFLVYQGIRGGAWDDMIGLLMAMANMWGLCLATLLLGYGLVELPRKYWHKADRRVQFLHAQWRVSHVFEETEETKEALVGTIRVVDELAARMGEAHVHQKLVHAIQEACPALSDMDIESAEAEVHRAAELPIEQLVKSDNHVTEKTLIALHKHVKNLTKKVHLVDAQWRDVVEHALELEDAMVKERTGVPPAWKSGAWAALSWRLRVYHASLATKALSVTLGLLSCVLIWCEITILSPMSLSPLGALVQAAQGDQFSVQLTVLVPFVYLSLCCFFGMFRLRLSAYYAMHGKRRTDENSMLFNGSYLLRLIAPLGYNFVNLLRVSDTTFQNVLGRMEVVPFLGSSFNDALPVLIGVFCVCTLFNVFGRVLRLVGVSRFDNSADFDDEHVKEGAQLLRREKRKRGISVDNDALI